MKLARRILRNAVSIYMCCKFVLCVFCALRSLSAWSSPGNLFFEKLKLKRILPKKASRPSPLTLTRRSCSPAFRCMSCVPRTSSLFLKISLVCSSSRPWRARSLLSLLSCILALKSAAISSSDLVPITHIDFNEQVIPEIVIRRIEQKKNYNRKPSSFYAGTCAF